MLREVPPAVEEQCLIDVHELNRRAAQEAVTNFAGFAVLVAAIKKRHYFIKNV